MSNYVLIDPIMKRYEDLREEIQEISKECKKIETEKKMCKKTMQRHLDMCATTNDISPTVTCIVFDHYADGKENGFIFINLPLSKTVEQLKSEIATLYSYPQDSYNLWFRQKDYTFLRIGDQAAETLERLGFSTEMNHLMILSKEKEDFNCVSASSTEEVDENIISSLSNLVVDKCNYSFKLRSHIPSKDSSCTKDVVTDESISQNDTFDKVNKLSAPTSFERRDAAEEISYQDNSATGVCNRVTCASSENDFLSHRPKRDLFCPDLGTGFVGLVNQAMTCYLNSLLQTLFMTPEFRNTLYKWEFDGSEEEGSKSIPYQLQKLFLQLQTSDKAAVGTTDLTTSFGWDSSEAWQQHDVQELCRVMFDALEQKFKNTSQADLISRLYEGKLKDYVKCLECCYESAREDTFLDVPLVVRPFGSSQAYSSVGEALEAFVTPEILQESNQYFCERCNKKCDAHKGLKFLKFPYLLMLQLKRFDFDPVTMHRIKLNDRVSFPQILNLNDFIKSDNSPEACDDGDTTDSGSALDDEGIGYASGSKTGCSLSPEAFSDNDLPDDDEGIDVGSNGPLENNHELCINERNLKKSMEKGPNVYELFSIMVHSGSASGGHYYAYIKCFKNGEWYCFNDSQVTKITHDDIIKTFGGGLSRGYYSSAYSSSSNAYMLIYRQVSKEKNADCMTPEEFPDHIKTLLQRMIEQEEKERIQKELDRSICKIKFFCQHPRHNITKEMILKIHKDCSLQEATETAYSIMNLDGLVPLNCCRLVKYDEYSETIESSFDLDTDETIGELLGGVKSNYKFDLLLEIKKPHEKFHKYMPGGATIKIHVVDLEKELVFNSHIYVQCCLSSTVEDLGLQVKEALGAENNVRMVVMNPSLILLHDPSKTLKSENFHNKGDKLYVEYQDQEDAKKLFVESKLYKLLDSHRNTIYINISLPQVDQATIDRLRLHDSDPDPPEDPNEPSSEEDKTNNVPEDNQVCLTSEKDSDKSNVSPKEEESKKETSSNESEEGEYTKTVAWVGDYIKTAAFSKYVETFFPDLSEDSSLTDSERTLVGDALSPRNNSPDIADPEMDLDLESLCSSSDCTKLELNEHKAEDAKVEKFDLDSDSAFSNKEETKRPILENHTDNAVAVQNPNFDSETSQSACESFDYFTAFSYTDSETNEKMLKVCVDKRMKFETFKERLVPYVGVQSNCFKIFWSLSEQEMECVASSGGKQDLSAYANEKLIVKLGRPLRKCEYSVELYLLRLNDQNNMIKYLMDCVILKDMTVLALKEQILPELWEKFNLNIPLNRCRLRKKFRSTPGKILLSHLTFESYSFFSNNQLYLEELPEPEPQAAMLQFTLFARMWHPSTYTVDPIKEIFLKSYDTNMFCKMLSEISQVPEEHIEFAKAPDPFPSDVPLLDIERKLEWINLTSLEPSQIKMTFFIDGVVYFKDTREELKQLSFDDRRTLRWKQNEENSILGNSREDRLSKSNKLSYGSKREKALKFYTIDSPKDDQSKSSQSTSQSLVINVYDKSKELGQSTQSICSVNPELD